MGLGVAARTVCETGPTRVVGPCKALAVVAAQLIRTTVCVCTHQLVCSFMHMQGRVRICRQGHACIR